MPVPRAEFGNDWLIMEGSCGYNGGDAGPGACQQQPQVCGCSVEAFSQVLTEQNWKHPGPGLGSSVSEPAIIQGEVALCSKATAVVQNLLTRKYFKESQKLNCLSSSLLSRHPHPSFLLFPATVLQRTMKENKCRTTPLYLQHYVTHHCYIRWGFVNFFLTSCS